jgi:hypothetical protein
MGKVMQYLLSVNCHDSHARGHERHGLFTRLVGFGWVGSVGCEFSRLGSWYVAGEKTMCMVWLQMGCL